MIVRAPVIVTMNGAPLIDGAVRIEGDRIGDIGKFSELKASSPKIIELNDHVLLPGLINAHCHLDYTGLRGKIPPQKSFAAWIHAINAEKAKLIEGDYLQSIADGLRESLRFGTTSMVNLEAFPKLIAQCPSNPLRVWWCAELIDVSASEGTDKILAPAISSLLRNKNSRSGCGLAPHALYTASPALIRRCIEIAEREDCLLTIHLAESREEMEMFGEHSGPLFEFLRSLGRAESDRMTPLENFLQTIRDRSTSLRSAQDDREKNAANWIVAHLNELTEEDFGLLENLRDKFSIAHCPRSCAYFRHSPFAFERLRNLGFNICLATDSLASNADLSLFAEMRAFQKSHGEIPVDELLQMVTVNPAKALGRVAELGKIAPGYLADLIALPITGTAGVSEQIVAFNGDVRWMMIDGKVL